MKIRASVLLGLAFSLVSATAAAELSAGVYGGYGLPPKDGGEDHLRFGYGARAGFSFVIPIYVGAAATWHTGSKDPEPSVPRNYFNYYGVEGGVDFTVGPVGLRPYAMVGAADVHSTRSADSSFWSPYYGFGLMPTWRFLDLPGIDLFLGLDARFVHVTKKLEKGDTAQGLTGFPVYLSVGARI